MASETESKMMPIAEEKQDIPEAAESQTDKKANTKTSKCFHAILRHHEADEYLLIVAFATVQYGLKLLENQKELITLSLVAGSFICCDNGRTEYDVVLVRQHGGPPCVRIHLYHADVEKGKQFVSDNSFPLTKFQD